MEKIRNTIPLKHTFGRVVVKIDMKAKNFHTFQNGLVIRRERQYNDFNRRVTQPVNAIVVSAESIPTDSEILIHHNATHDSNKIFDYEELGGEENESDIQYFSIPEYECFAWRGENGEMNPMKGYEFGLRVFEPYKGTLQGIDHKQIKDVIFVTTGELKGKVVNVVRASDYEIVYQDTTGREGNLIRFRHSETEELEMEEVLFVNDGLTKRVNNRELLVGIELKSAKFVTDGQ